MFTFEFEPGSGILCVRVAGMWTMPEVERYGREVGGQFAAARAHAGALRLLIELSRTEILSQNLLQPLAEAGMRYSQPEDLVAMVVVSSLMKLQMKRMVGDPSSSRKAPRGRGSRPTIRFARRGESGGVRRSARPCSSPRPCFRVYSAAGLRGSWRDGC